MEVEVSRVACAHDSRSLPTHIGRARFKHCGLVKKPCCCLPIHADLNPNIRRTATVPSSVRPWLLACLKSWQHLQRELIEWQIATRGPTSRSEDLST